MRNTMLVLLAFLAMWLFFYRANVAFAGGCGGGGCSTYVQVSPATYTQYSSTTGPGIVFDPGSNNQYSCGTGNREQSIDGDAGSGQNNPDGDSDTCGHYVMELAPSSAGGYDPAVLLGNGNFCPYVNSNLGYVSGSFDSSGRCVFFAVENADLFDASGELQVWSTLQNSITPGSYYVYGYARAGSGDGYSQIASTPLTVLSAGGKGNAPTGSANVCPWGWPSSIPLTFQTCVQFQVGSVSNPLQGGNYCLSQCQMYTVYVPPGSPAPSSSDFQNLLSNNEFCNWYQNGNKNDSYGRCLFGAPQYQPNAVYACYDSSGNPVNGDQDAAYCTLTAYTTDTQAVALGQGTYYGYFSYTSSSPIFQYGPATVTVTDQVKGTMSVTPGLQVPPGTGMSSGFFGSLAGTTPVSSTDQQSVITEFTPNSISNPCIPPQTLNSCPASDPSSQCSFTHSAGNEGVSIFYGVFDVSTSQITVNTNQPYAEYCQYYSPDYGNYFDNYKGQGGLNGVFVTSPAAALIGTSAVQIGTFNINDGINLNVPSPVPTNSVVQITATPTAGCSYSGFGGGVTCDPYSIEVVANGGVCSSSTTGACPLGNLNYIAQQQGTTPCLLTSGSTNPQTLVQVDTSNTNVGDTFVFCAYQPQDQASGQGIMQINGAGSSGGGGPCPPSNPDCGVIGGGGQQPPVGIGAATNAICSVYFVVNTVLFILALTIMILGGAIYAGANVLPGSTRGMVQGYAMGMVLGGIVGALIAVIAPWVLSTILGNDVGTIVASVCPAP